jgi:FkbM family methyltransferase
MSLKKFLNPVFSLAARGCEKSPAMANLVRRFNFRGKGSIVQRIRPEAMRREVTAECSGIRYQLDLHDDVQRELYFNQYERDDIREVLSLVPAGGVCLDIGANNGAFALQLARKVGPRGTVHAFEPDPYIFSRLVQNCRLNGFEDRLYCHNVAVTNAKGPITFYQSDRSHSGWGSLVKFADITTEAQEVEGITLDSFLTQERIAAVDLLKVDVEAHEPELLAGAQTSLAGRMFRYVMIEFNGIRLAERGKTLDDFLQPLLRAGYQPGRLRVELLRELQQGTVPMTDVCTNFLFERKPKAN